MTKRSNVLSLIFIAFLSLIAVFTLTACGKKTEAPATQAPGATTAVVTTTASKPEIRVFYDQNFVFDSESIENISDAINVEIITNGVSQKVDYTVKGYEVSDDGQFVDITIEAYGMEQTIRVPYLELLYPIRPELRPLYNLINEEGVSALSINAKGSTTDANNNKNNLFDLNLLANATSTEDLEFALTNNDNLLVLLDGNSLIIGSYVMEIDREAIMETLMSISDSLLMEDDEDEIVELLSDMDDEEDYDLEELFVSISSILDQIDMLVGSPMLIAFNASITKNENTYSISINSKTLLTVLPLIVNEDQLKENGIDIDKIVDVLDENMDGAIKNGEITFDIELSIKDNGVSLGLTATNEKNNSSFNLLLDASLYSEALELPEAEETEAESMNIEITIPFILQRKETNSTLRVVINSTSMLADEDSDILYATLTDNSGDESTTQLEFVLNNHYAFLDLSGLNEKYQLDESETLTFYQEFILDGENVTFAEYIPTLVKGLLNNNEDDYIDDDDEFDDNDQEIEVDPRFEYGYGAESANGEALMFDLGVTLEEFKDALHVYTFDADDNQIDYLDYTVVDFDGTKSFSGCFEIELAPGYSTNIYVVICDLSNVETKSITPEKALIRLGDSVKDVEDDTLYAVITYTDGSVNWEDNTMGFTVKQIMLPTGELVEATSEYVFNSAGDGMISASYNEKDYLFVYHVYDPNNPIVDSIVCANASIYISKDTTLDEIYDELTVYAVYDNLESDEIFEYEIVDFKIGDRLMKLEYDGFNTYVEVNYTDMEEPSQENSNSFMNSLLSHIRFLEISEEDDNTSIILKVLSAIKEIYNENIEEFQEIYSIEFAETSVEVTVNLNTEDDKDLFSLINYFFGVPTEDGFDDIDEEYIITKIAELREDSMTSTVLMMVERAFGFSVEEIIVDSAMTISVSIEDGFVLSFDLYGDRGEYLTTGLAFNSIEPSANYEISEEMLEASKELSELPNYLMALIFGSLM